MLMSDLETFKVSNSSMFLKFSYVFVDSKCELLEFSRVFETSSGKDLVFSRVGGLLEALGDLQ